MEYDINTLRELVSKIEQMYATVQRAPATLGTLEGLAMSLYCTAHYRAAPAIERLRPDPAYSPVTADILLDPKTKMPTWNCAIAETVALTCPHCHSSVDCEVQIVRDGPIYAEIETEFCEDCHKHLCPKCPRSKGEGEEEGLTWCLDCRPALPAKPQSQWISKIQAAGPFRIFGADNPQPIEPGILTDGSKETK